MKPTIRTTEAFPRRSMEISARACALRALGVILLAAFCPAANLRAQSVESQMQEMRQSIQELQQQVRTLQEQLRETQTMLARDGKAQSSTNAVHAESADSKPAAPASDAALTDSSYGAPARQSEQPQEAQPAEDKTSLLESEIADLAQTKVESNSRFPVRIFGTIVSDASFNSGAVNWLDNPSDALPALAPGVSTKSFSLSLRQSRLGAIINGPTLGGWKTSGFVVADFFAGSTALTPDTVMPVPRLLYGYVRIENGNSTIEVGQDQMILAPQNPTSIAALSFPELYEAGNLYSRVPQVRLQQTFKAGANSQLIATAGVLDADASDANTVAELGFGSLAETPHRPAVQARLAWKWRGGDARNFEIGVSGHRGSELFPTGSQPSWGAALDFNAQYRRLGFAGEYYAGRNLAPLGGAIGQFRAKSTGGFAEARFKATGRLSFNSGFGTDHLYDFHSLPTPWLRNSGVYANSIFQFTPEVAGSVEYRWLSLVPGSRVLHRDNYLDLVLAYSF